MKEKFEKEKRRLTPSEVYNNIKSNLKGQGFNQVDEITEIVSDHRGEVPIASAFYHKDKNKLVYVHYPVLDTFVGSLEDPRSLNKLMRLVKEKDFYNSVNTKLKEEYEIEKCPDDPIKIFPISEKRTHFGFKRAHFSLAFTMGEEELTILDSKPNSFYSRARIKNKIPHNNKKVRVIHTGKQEILNDWACGHYVVESVKKLIEHVLKGNTTPTFSLKDLNFKIKGKKPSPKQSDTKTEENIEDFEEIFDEIKGSENTKEDEKSINDSVLNEIEDILGKMDVYMKGRALKTNHVFFFRNGMNDYIDRLCSYSNLLSKLKDGNVDSINSFLDKEIKYFNNTLALSHHYREHLEKLRDFFENNGSFDLSKLKESIKKKQAFYEKQYEIIEKNYGLKNDEKMKGLQLKEDDLEYDCPDNNFLYPRQAVKAFNLKVR